MSLRMFFRVYVPYLVPSSTGYTGPDERSNRRTFRTCGRNDVSKIVVFEDKLESPKIAANLSSIHMKHPNDASPKMHGKLSFLLFHLTEE